MSKKIHRRFDADPKEGRRKYGKATFADPVNNKYPIDTGTGRSAVSWARASPKRESPWRGCPPARAAPARS
jgi:hypothetical protein